MALAPLVLLWYVSFDLRYGELIVLPDMGRRDEGGGGRAGRPVGQGWSDD